MSESDPAKTVFNSRANKLASLLASGADRAQLWRPEELAAIFRHQMAAPVLVDLGALDERTAARLRLLGEAQGLLLKSFADLFHHPAPVLELLEMVKDFARANMDLPGGALPREIAATLYYTSIAAALVRLDTRISQLSDADLRRGLDWLRPQPWLDEPTRSLLDQALAKLPAGPKGAGP
jgi:hypothetical protein